MRWVAIVAFVALAGCEQPGPYHFRWECRTVSNAQVRLYTDSHLYSPAYTSSFDAKGFEWKPEAVAACRAIEARQQ